MNRSAPPRLFSHVTEFQQFLALSRVNFDCVPRRRQYCSKRISWRFYGLTISIQQRNFFLTCDSSSHSKLCLAFWYDLLTLLIWALYSFLLCIVQALFYEFFITIRFPNRLFQNFWVAYRFLDLFNRYSLFLCEFFSSGSVLFFGSLKPQVAQRGVIKMLGYRFSYSKFC